MPTILCGTPDTARLYPGLYRDDRGARRYCPACPALLFGARSGGGTRSEGTGRKDPPSHGENQFRAIRSIRWCLNNSPVGALHDCVAPRECGERGEGLELPAQLCDVGRRSIDPAFNELTAAHELSSDP